NVLLLAPVGPRSSQVLALPDRTVSGLPGRNHGDAEAPALAPGRRPVAAAGRRPPGLVAGVPAAAPVHPARALGGPGGVGVAAVGVVVFIVPVEAPLRDVAVHVVQAELVAVEPAHVPGATDKAAGVGVEPGDAVAAEVVFLVGTDPSSTSVFPLRLR